MRGEGRGKDVSAGTPGKTPGEEDARAARRVPRACPGWSSEAAITLDDGEASTCPHVEAMLAEYLGAARRGELEGVDGVRLVYEVFPATAPERAALVIAPGAGESSIRYLELVHDWRRRHPEHALYLLNHRGQGFSQRLLGGDWEAARADAARLAEYQKCHVERFDDYVADLARFLAEVVRPGEHPAVFGLAHSMGAAVFTRLLQQAGSDCGVRALAASAPMYELRGLRGVPARRDRLGQAALALARVSGRDQGYLIGQQPFDPARPFVGADGTPNPVTTSLPRFRLRRHLQWRFPETSLGGPTWRWAAEAYAATARLRLEAGHIAVPLLVLAPGEDPLVITAAAAEVCAAAPRARLLPLPASRHEPLNERDAIRSAALDAIEGFFAEHLRQR